ncbi:nucleoside hydrolase [Lentibacillus sp. CBA3610]|uniref:nucleoside hydrolase n=1 Tax=Lentibacillus sp. CBA3610 TaxID=2518176 RepID=UPI0015956D7D|nr:nucleoside hydrolase [Lentibacillus sp. CBA3610]QKY70740.1 nucleoside hydrolase [Lentibacillus sp. CBA3610]
MQKKIIIDCDPGHDDAMAIIMAASGASHLQLDAITTVAGNVDVAKNTKNALRVCELIGLHDVPVAMGADRPLVREPLEASHVHGKSGLDGTALPQEPAKQPVDQHAVDVLIEKLMASDGAITIAAIGPLTNIALSIRKEPRIVPKIKEIALMGGGTYGNRTPAAEFNIYADAEAAKIVFESGAPITMFGLDVTHQALATSDKLEELKAIDNPVATAVADMLTFYSGAYKGKFAGAALHDPCPIAYLIDPAIVELDSVRVDVETTGEFTYGMTVVDLKGATGRKANVHFARQLNPDRFWQLFMDALRSY